MEGAPEDDSLPSRINRFELSVVDAFTDRCGECENTGIAMFIDLVFQSRGKDRFRRYQKIIDDIEIIFMLFAEPQIGQGDRSDLLLRQRFSIHSLANRLVEQFQPFDLESRKEFF